MIYKKHLFKEKNEENLSNTFVILLNYHSLVTDLLVKLLLTPLMFLAFYDYCHALLNVSLWLESFNNNNNKVFALYWNKPKIYDVGQK